MICSLQWPNDMVQYASRSVNFLEFDAPPSDLWKAPRSAGLRWLVLG